MLSPLIINRQCGPADVSGVSGGASAPGFTIPDTVSVSVAVSGLDRLLNFSGLDQEEGCGHKSH